LPGKEVSRVEDEHRKQLTVVEAAEYLGLTRGQVHDMVERGVLEADKFAPARSTSLAKRWSASSARLHRKTRTSSTPGPSHAVLTNFA
jgi:hypothetical protein